MDRILTYITLASDEGEIPLMSHIITLPNVVFGPDVALSNLLYFYDSEPFSCGT